MERRPPRELRHGDAATGWGHSHSLLEGERDLLALIAEFNISGDAMMVVRSEYLAVVVVRK